MALFEAVANVVTRYKADVSDNIRGLQKLKGEERARAEALLEQHKKTNDALESQIKGFQKVASGVVLLTAGFAAATKGLDAYAKTSDEAKEKVEKLKETTSKAFDTLYAGIGQTVMAFEPLISGVASLVQLMADLHIAGPAAVAAIGFAITKNPKVTALLAAIALAADVGSSLVNSEKDQKRFLELGAAGATVRGGGNKPEVQALIKKYEIEDALEANKKVDAVNDALGLSRGPFDQLAKTFSRFNASLGERVAAIAESALGVDPWSGPVKFDKATDKVKVKGKEGPFSSYVGATSTEYDFGGSMGSTSLGAAADSVPLDEFGREILPATMGPYQNLVDAEKGRQATVLEGMFGKIEEFDAYREGFSMLTGAATAAYDALVDGNMNAGVAVKAFLKDAIKGLGSRMLVRSLEETAEGIAALSSPLTAAAAPAHFAAAKMFAGGAVIAGVLARGLGSGGGGVSGGGGSASPSLPRDMGTGRDSYDGGKAKVIIIGDPMSDDSPRYQARNIAKQLTRAERTSAGRYA